MKAEIEISNLKVSVDLSKPIDISMAIKNDSSASKAWYQDAPVFEPVRMGDFVGSVKEGGSVNFYDIKFNPHAHGTHTEGLGHISKEKESANHSLLQYFFLCRVVSITPEENGNDRIIKDDAVEWNSFNGNEKAIAIRTLPNTKEKLTTQYSGSNPPYLEIGFIKKINELGIEHLLIDLPSVDREEDGGKLQAHHLFWNYPEKPQHHKTITEFIFIPNEVPDGLYLLNLMVSAFQNDALPSRPILYRIIS